MNSDTKRQTHHWYQQRHKKSAHHHGSGLSIPSTENTRQRGSLTVCLPASDDTSNATSPTPLCFVSLCQGVPQRQLRRAVMARWVSQGVDVHRTDATGLTALMLVSQRGDLELVRYLVGQGVRVNARDSSGFTALTWAAWHGHREVVRYLKSRGATVNVPAVLFAAARQGRLDTLQILHQHGARLRCYPTDLPHIAESTLLAHAAAHGQLAVVNYILQDPTSTSVKDRLTAMRAALVARPFSCGIISGDRARSALPQCHALHPLEVAPL